MPDLLPDSAGVFGAKQRHAAGAELEHLHSTGAIKVRAQNSSIISLQLLGYAMSRVVGKGHLVASILELSKAGSHISGLATTIIPSMAVPEAVPEAATVHPVVLPFCKINLNTFPKHYSLNKKLQSEEGLHKEMGEFVTWLSTPIMINRAGKKSACRTVQNLVKNVNLYFGFCHWEYELEKFSLALFLDTQKLSAYIAFQLAKKNGKACLSQILSHARKVCSYLRRDTDPSVTRVVVDPALVAAVNRVEVWLLRLSKQIGSVLLQPKPDIAVLERDGKWLPADELVVLLDKLRLEALASVPSDKSVRLSAYTARHVHDAALSSVMFGFIPCPRLSCVRTLQCPWFKKCIHEDCRGSQLNSECKGNILEMRGDDMWLVLSHHKNSAKWDGSLIQFRLPSALRDLLHLYLTRCHSVLSYGCPTVFTDQKSRPMVAASQLSFYWESILRRCEAKATFGPNL